MFISEECECDYGTASVQRPWDNHATSAYYQCRVHPKFDSNLEESHVGVPGYSCCGGHS